MARPSTKTPAEIEAAAKAKETQFIKLASRRVDNALKTIAMLRPLANKASYTYTEEQVAKIADALEQEVIKTVNAFKKGEAEKGTGFSL